MPSPEPPLNTTRIMKVLEPEGGYYVVVVRVDPSVAARFPDKPFNLPIEDEKLGLKLAKRESELYAGYALVSIEPAENGGKDQFWYFQKLDGPVWDTVAKSRENLTPQKFRSSVVTTTTEQEVNPDTAPTALSGDLVLSQVERTPNTGKSVRKEVTETINENASPLVGEEYGDIITKSVSESLVSEGTAADTGIDVVSSAVEPLGNGKAVKQTKRAKSPGWPDPLDKEVSKENGNSPPARYTRDITRTRTSRKIAPSAIPDTPALSGNQVGKAYKKETPDRAEEVITTQTLTLNTSAIDEALEQKPFVTIRSRMTPGTAPVLPTVGNGSSRLVYEGPNGQMIYENTAEIATARETAAGQEKDEKPYLRLTTNKRYSINPTVSTATGSSNVVFNDGNTLVYEVSEIAAEAKPYSVLAGKDAKLGYRIEETEVFGTDASLITKTGNVSVAYDDGSTRVYKKTEVRGYLNNVEFDSEVKNTKLFKETTHTSFKTSAVGDDSKDWGGTMVYSDGDFEVFRIDEVSIAAKTPITYYTAINAQMPSVLKSLLLEPIEMLPNSGGAVRDKVCVRAIIEEGYSGLFKAKIIEEYTENSSLAESFVPVIFKPTAINYDGLNYGVSIGETLHDQIVFEDAIGTSDPDYAPLQELSLTFRTFAATEGYTTIPSGYQNHAIQVEPYKNGYLVKRIYIQYKP